MKHAFAILRWPYEALVTVVGFLYFGTGGILFTVVGALAHLASQSHANKLRGRRAVSAAFRSFLGLLRLSGLIRLDLAALDALRAERGLVIAPNHPGLLDAVLVMSRVPDVACILKAGLLQSPFLGGGARWSGHISNDSGSGMVRASAAELRAGGQLLVFPEGTRTRGPLGALNAFKGGVALIAREAQAPVQTVLLRPNTTFLGKTWPWLRKPTFPLVFRAELGRRFDPPAKGADVKPWVAELEAYFRSELGNTGKSTGRTPE